MTQASTHWKEQPERSNRLALGVICWIALRLGRPVARLVLWPIAAYFLLFGRAAGAASRAYLSRALGRPAGRGDIGRHLFCFSATILDRVYFLKDRFDLFDIEIVGEALMQAQRESGQGAMLFGAHMGSFEAIRALGRQVPGQRIALTMYEDNARKVNATLDAINPANRPEIIPLGHVDTMLRVKHALDDGALVGLLADRSLGDEATRPVELLGAAAAIPTGAFRIAAMLRQRVIFMAGLYLGGNRYRIKFVPIMDFADIERSERSAAIDTAIDRYAAELEQCLREAPLNWFNFFPFWPDDRP